MVALQERKLDTKTHRDKRQLKHTKMAGEIILEIFYFNKALCLRTMKYFLSAIFSKPYTLALA